MKHLLAAALCAAVAGLIAIPVASAASKPPKQVPGTVTLSYYGAHGPAQFPFTGNLTTNAVCRGGRTVAFSEPTAPSVQAAPFGKTQTGPSGDFGSTAPVPFSAQNSSGFGYFFLVATVYKSKRNLVKKKGNRKIVRRFNCLGSSVWGGVAWSRN